MLAVRDRDAQSRAEEEAAHPYHHGIARMDLDRPGTRPFGLAILPMRSAWDSGAVAETSRDVASSSFSRCMYLSGKTCIDTTLV